MTTVSTTRLQSSRTRHLSQPRAAVTISTTKTTGMATGAEESPFFYMLDAMYKTDRTRFKRLTARIHSLCTVIEYTQSINPFPGYSPRGPFEGDNIGNDDLMWNLFPDMVNLEILELHAEWPGAQYQPTLFDGNLPVLSRLRFAKLFGYIPQDFAWYIYPRFRCDSRKIGTGATGSTRGAVLAEE